MNRFLRRILLLLFGTIVLTLFLLGWIAPGSPTAAHIDMYHANRDMKERKIKGIEEKSNVIFQRTVESGLDLRGW